MPAQGAQGTSGSRVQIFASGDMGGEEFALQIDGQTVEQFTATQNLSTFEFQTAQPVTPDQVRIEFLNDQYDPAAGIDANLRVDAIQIDGTRIETESSSVFSTGTFLAADLITPGFGRGEVLHTNGFFQFGGLPKPKNVVFILLDDADFSDFEFNNSLLNQPDAVTPFMNDMRRNGRLFDNFYAASSICSPTRISVLTGRTPVQFGGIDAWETGVLISQQDPGMSGLPNTIPQLGTTMKALGKSTGFFGKWHIGWSLKQFRPPALGFDKYTKILGTSRDHAWDGRFRFFRDTGDSIEDVDSLDSRLADDTIGFIDECIDQGEEFFVDYSPFAPHSPWIAPRSYQGDEFDLSTIRGNLLALMNSVDADIGRIVAKLRERGVLNDTLILITSDNGGQRMAQHHERYLRGNKGALLEAGVRVPLIAYWPGVIAPDSTNHSVETTYDVLPTVMELCGGDPTSIYPMIDGRSFADLMFDDIVVPHEPIFWEISGNPVRTSDLQAQRSKAIRVGDHKLVKVEGRDEHTQANAFLLFNVALDPREQQNLADSQPALVEQLRREMELARARLSRVNRVPEFTFGEVVVPADPRMDVTSKDMTLTMSVTIPTDLNVGKTIYLKPGSQHLRLNRDGLLSWRITGADFAGNPINYFLKGRRVLRPGQTFDIKLIIGGFKNDIPTAELYINGRLMDELDRYNPMISTIWSAAQSDAIIGDQDLLIDGIEYHTLRFFP